MQTPDEYAFFAIAEPLANLGIRVFPIKPQNKVPIWGLRFLEEATTDLGKIAAWHFRCRDYNVAMLAGDVCFLEFDVKGGVTAMCEEMGQPMPGTRMQRSGSGGSHMIFLHTDRSRAIGNRSVNRDAHEWFSFRAMNRYLIGAGSLHPNGNRYKLAVDVAPSPIPDWVCDFIEKHSRSEQGSKTRTGGRRGDYPTLDEDFDLLDFCEFFGITGDQDGDYFVLEECPIAGHQHLQSVKTGFRYDGEHLGWSCFAGSCHGSTMTIKDVIKFLEEEVGEEYPHRIWAEIEITEDDLIKWGIDPDAEDDPLPPPEVSAPEPTTLVLDSATPGTTACEPEQTYIPLSVIETLRGGLQMHPVAKATDWTQQPLTSHPADWGLVFEDIDDLYVAAAFGDVNRLQPESQDNGFAYVQDILRRKDLKVMGARLGHRWLATLAIQKSEQQDQPPEPKRPMTRDEFIAIALKYGGTIVHNAA